jgi:hypothetical protein
MAEIRSRRILRERNRKIFHGYASTSWQIYCALSRSYESTSKAI